MKSLPEEPTPRNTNSFHVLIVDDEPSQMELAKLNLEDSDLSFTITTTLSASEALKLLRDNSFDCIVSDYKMPEMNGVQLCTEVRKTSEIPFIIYTARGSEEVASAAFAAGIDDYVRKEATSAHYKLLAKRIRHTVEKKRAEKELQHTEEELRASNEQVQEYANKLERMVDDRTSKLKESEERLRAFIDSTEDGFGLFDSQLRLIDLNKVGLQLFLMGSPPGTTKEDLIGKRYSEIFPGIEKTERYEAMLRVLRTGEPMHWEGASWVSPDIWHSNTAFLIGSNLGLVSRNISKQRNLQEELQRAEVISAVEQMGATVAHDLRGPLGQVVQAVNMTKQDPTLIPRMLQLIEENAVRSLKMIADWRSSTREIVPNPVNTDLIALVKNIIEGTTLPSNVEVEISLGKSLDLVKLDPDIMHRVIDNLVKNAVEAMPNGGKLTISAKKNDDKIVISVGDTGVGIPEGYKARIFSPLYTTKTGGMGLGLTYCRRAVGAQGGSIDFESEVGKGTTFTIRLPTQ